jgi:hypothetical protein
MPIQKYPPFFQLKSPFFNKSIPISKEKKSQNFLKGFPLSNGKAVPILFSIRVDFKSY